MPLVTQQRFSQLPGPSNIAGSIALGGRLRNDREGRQFNALANAAMTGQTTEGEPVEDRSALIQQMALEFPERFERMQGSLGLISQTQKNEAADFALRLKSTPFDQRQALIEQRSQKLTAEGRDPQHTDSLQGMTEQNQNDALDVIQLMPLTPKERLSKTQLSSASEREFEALIKNLPPEEQEKARRVKLGLAPRAVGSAVQTITEAGGAEEVGETVAVIEQRKEFGKKTGASRAKAIDSGFDRIVNIDKGIANLDRAIIALDEGASTGVMQKFSPSIRTASIELDQIRNTLALDVLNSATFGALSEKELELTKETALPDKLSPPELRDWLVRRKAAEQKLRDYFQEQIDWLEVGGPDGKGGTVAGFLRMKRRQQGGGQSAAAPQAGQQAPGQAVLKFNPATGRLE